MESRRWIVKLLFFVSTFTSTFSSLEVNTFTWDFTGKKLIPLNGMGN